MFSMPNRNDKRGKTGESSVGEQILSVIAMFRQSSYDLSECIAEDTEDYWNPHSGIDQNPKAILIGSRVSGLCSQ
jgi:hypothetical protein